ncbi:MAG TPA: bifunctional phosphopantothenoylcysteine decarboxylase/phosphopantothenate--cysteine ligase CoaBC, partial [Beutenbergiaceae bacterium]|nr:bifunctional phosphopantothenoylcysteine decarboxylase/phosphopantothenate--cysteine ligase CoaBC [Beutenbergiaceae bacterium]
MRIVLGVTGGIAAYKAVLLLRLLTEAGHEVRVVPTRSALEFVGSATWQALSGQPVTTSVFQGADVVDHVRLGREAELVIVAPATADLLARVAGGRSDDLLTATLLTATCPVLLAPAMHTEMWQHPATVANVELLRRRGVHILEPDSGRLTGADSGPGRLPEPEQIRDAALALTAAGPLAGHSVVVSAGGTREALDPVRFLGNRSSGRQGVALAAAAARAGAAVSLVAANVEETVLASLPPGVKVIDVESARELAEQMTARSADADVLVMAAAVADFRPARASEAKIKKHAPHAGTQTPEDPAPIELRANPDILVGLVQRRRPGQIVVGFGAETGDDDGDALSHGRAKARRKGADLLAVNQVGDAMGFGDVPNAVVILDHQGQEVSRAAGTKDEVASGVVAAITALLAERVPAGPG